MDEIALRKGHQEYITVLVDLDRHVPVAFVNSRKHKDIKKVLYSWGSEILNQITEVSIDMSASYRSLVRKVLPDATIVADRFHVMKLVGEELIKTSRGQEKISTIGRNASAEGGV